MEATLADVVSVKGASIQTTTTDRTVLDAVNLMHRQNIGGLLVVSDDGLDGIFTERDVLFRVVNEGLDPASTTVGQVMTRNPFTVSNDTTVATALGEVTERRIRHLPMVENGNLIGLVSSGDLSRYMVTYLREEIRDLTQEVEKEGFKFKATALLVAVFIVLSIISVMTS